MESMVLGDDSQPIHELVPFQGYSMYPIANIQTMLQLLDSRDNE